MDSDISNFSSSTPHRMPTISAAQALQHLSNPVAARGISTGVEGLDRVLGMGWEWDGGGVEGNGVGDAGDGGREGGGGGGVDMGDESGDGGGILRGQVTELWGPPGVGKTAFGSGRIQIAANALRDGLGVVWVDTAHPLPGPRLKEVLSSVRATVDIEGQSSSSQTSVVKDLLKNLVHFTTPTLSHLIALLCHQIPSFPSQNTGLIVIDSLSVLVANSYPRNIDNKSNAGKVTTTPKYGPQAWAASRKWSVLQYIVSSLQKLATIRNIAVVVLNQSVTKMQSGAGATLISSVSSTAWDAGIATSIVLFRDWDWDGNPVRYVRVLRANGGTDGGKGAVGKVLAFTVESYSLKEIQLADTYAIFQEASLATPSRKRKVDEIRDSEDEEDLEGSDEDYGWAEDDAGELPQPPPQWQGSEDILVPGDDERAEEKNQEEEDQEDQELVEEAEN